MHTSALPTGNHTTDIRITEIADGESRVVVTKDRDFRDGHLLSGSPRRLLIVATGNITNTELLALFRPVRASPGLLLPRPPISSLLLHDSGRPANSHKISLSGVTPRDLPDVIARMRSDRYPSTFRPAVPQNEPQSRRWVAF